MRKSSLGCKVPPRSARSREDETSVTSPNTGFPFRAHRSEAAVVCCKSSVTSSKSEVGRRSRQAALPPSLPAQADKRCKTWSSSSFCRDFSYNSDIVFSYKQGFIEIQGGKAPFQLGGKIGLRKISQQR